MTNTLSHFILLSKIALSHGVGTPETPSPPPALAPSVKPLPMRTVVAATVAQPALPPIRITFTVSDIVLQVYSCQFPSLNSNDYTFSSNYPVICTADIPNDKDHGFLIFRYANLIKNAVSGWSMRTNNVLSENYPQ